MESDTNPDGQDFVAEEVEEEPAFPLYDSEGRYLDGTE